MSGFHGEQTTADGLHVLTRWEYASTAARDAATYNAADEGGVARVGGAAPWVFYTLTDASGPTWVQIGAGGGGGGATDTVVGSSGITNIGTNVDANLAPTYGSTAGTVAQGDDARLSDARAPTGAAGGDLGGSYPNPTVDDGADATAIHDDTAGEILAVALKAVPASADVLLIEDSAGGNAKKRITVGSLPTGGGGGVTNTVVGTLGITNVGTNTDADLAPTYGAIASTITEGNDSRLSDARTPTVHASTHQDGGTDEIATGTPAAAAIPKADGSGTLDAWISASSETVAGILETATIAEVNTGTDAGRAVSPSSLSGSTLASDVSANNSKVTNATHTGEVTGSGALTIAADAVTNTKLANVATGTLKGRATAATGDPEDLTGAQATTLLDPFTSALQGVVPGSGGGTTNFLRADATWAAPPGGGGQTNTVVGSNGISNVGTNVDADLTPTYGTTAGRITEGNDARLSDARVPTGAAGGSLTGTYPNPGVADGADGTAIHDNVAGEIAAITVKGTPVGGDFLIIEDSAAANAKKHILISTLPGGGGGAIDTGNTLWVDADFGNDGTAVSDRQDLPFLTVGAAITASLSGDVIHVRPGVYAESGLTMNAGTVINGESWQTTSIGSAAAVADILTMGTDCGVNGITVIVPTAAHAGISHTAGTGSVTGINIQGDGATGIGDGIHKTGTGKLIGGLIRCETGGLNSYVRVSSGVLALDDVHCPQSAGTIAAVVLAEGGVWQCQGLNVGNTNVVDAVQLAGTATIRVYSPNIFNCSNAVHLTSDGPNVTIIGGKISATLRTVWVDSGLTGTGSTVRCLGTVLDPLFDFPPAAAVNTEFVLQFNQQESNTRDSRQRLIGADLALGFPELGSAAWIGKGAPYSAGISVYTTDGTETMVGSVVTGGNQTDVTAEAGSRSASTFAFQALTANNAIYFGSLRKDAASVPLKFWGLMLDQVAAGVDGTYAHEIWDGAAWVQVGVMAVSVAEEYRYADSVYLRAGTQEMVHFGITASTTWAQSTVGAITSYHARIRILTTVTTAPTWERSRLIESASVVNQIGQRSANGLSKWRSTVSAAGMRWSGTGTANGQVDMGTGAISWIQDLDSAKLNSDGDDAYIHLLLPQGICTAHPLKFRLIYGYDVYVNQPTLQLDSQRVAVANNIVADPGGGLVPIARTVALTPLTTAVEGVRDSWTGEVLAPNQVTRHTTAPLDISAYYEGDLVALRFTMVSGGGGTGTDILIYGIEIEAVQFTDGTIE